MTAIAVPAETSAGQDHRPPCSIEQVQFRQYRGEEDLSLVMELVDNELSEPYSIFTYRYFLSEWPQLCWFAFDGETCFGVVVCKQDLHRDLVRGYVGMLVVLKEYRGLGVGSELVKRCIKQMIEDKADEVVLECEVTNTGGLKLYQNLGFLRDKRLYRYYLSGSDAFRLKLLLPLHPERQAEMEAQSQLEQMKLAAESGLPADSQDNASPDALREDSESVLKDETGLNLAVDGTSIGNNPSSSTTKPDAGSQDVMNASNIQTDAPAQLSQDSNAVDSHVAQSVSGLGNGLTKSKRKPKKTT